MTEENAKSTGWEVADKVAHGVGATFSGIGWVLLKCWGLLLIAIGIALFVIAGGKAWWAGLIVIAYGLYLLFPGSKWVLW